MTQTTVIVRDVDGQDTVVVVCDDCGADCKCTPESHCGCLDVDVVQEAGESLETAS
jgi:hypothetical protein